MANKGQTLSGCSGTSGDGSTGSRAGSFLSARIWSGISRQSEPVQSIAIASVCGLGSEAILRSKFLSDERNSQWQKQRHLKGLFSTSSSGGNRFASDKLVSLAQGGASGLRGKRSLAIDGLCACGPAGETLNASVFSAGRDRWDRAKGRCGVRCFRNRPWRARMPARPNLNKAYIAKLGYALLDSVGKSGIHAPTDKFRVRRSSPDATGAGGISFCTDLVVGPFS